MRIKQIWFDDNGDTLIEKELEMRFCSKENPPSFEIMLTDEGTYPQQGIYIDYDTLMKTLRKIK